MVSFDIASIVMIDPTDQGWSIELRDGRRFRSETAAQAADRAELKNYPEYSLPPEIKQWLRENMPWAWLDRKNQTVTPDNVLAKNNHSTISPA